MVDNFELKDFDAIVHLQLLLWWGQGQGWRLRLEVGLHHPPPQAIPPFLTARVWSLLSTWGHHLELLFSCLGPLPSDNTCRECWLLSGGPYWRVSLAPFSNCFRSKKNPDPCVSQNVLQRGQGRGLYGSKGYQPLSLSPVITAASVLANGAC